MAEENRFESRLARRGGRIIDVESSISSQGPIISPQPGKTAPNASVIPLPSGEDTTPYMPIAPTPPGQPQPPAPDHYESWPPTMISLAEGAPVNAIAGRPMHEFTGIQPGNINPIEPAAPSIPEITIGFESAFSNAVNSRSQAGLSPKPWESGPGATFGPDVSGAISTVGRRSSGARLAPHPGEEPGADNGDADEDGTAPPAENVCVCVMECTGEAYDFINDAAFADWPIQPASSATLGVGQYMKCRLRVFGGTDRERYAKIWYMVPSLKGEAPDISKPNPPEWGDPSSAPIVAGGWTEGKGMPKSPQSGKPIPPTPGQVNDVDGRSMPCPDAFYFLIQGRKKGALRIGGSWGNNKCGELKFDVTDKSAPPGRPKVPILPPAPKPILPKDCECVLSCWNIETGQRSEIECTMDLWCEGGARGLAEFKNTPLVTRIDFDGDSRFVEWTINADGGFFTLQRLYLDNPPRILGDKAPNKRGGATCDKDHPIFFAILPTEKAKQALRDGNMSPMRGEITAAAPNSCGKLRIVVQPKPCDPKSVEDQAGALNAKAPDIAVIVLQTSSAPAKDSSQLPADPTGQVKSPVLVITIDFELIINTDVVFACPDCCCEYFFFGGMIVHINSQWVEGAKGAQTVAELEAARLEQMFKDADLRHGLKKFVSNFYPRCYSSKTCEIPPATTINQTLGPYAYSAQSVDDISGASGSYAGPAGDALCRNAQPIALPRQHGVLPDMGTVVTGDLSPWFDSFPSDADISWLQREFPPAALKSEFMTYVQNTWPAQAETLVRKLPELLSFAILYIVTTRLRLEAQQIFFERDGQRIHCWCVVPTYLKYSIDVQPFIQGELYTKDKSEYHWNNAADTEWPLKQLRAEWESNSRLRRNVALSFIFPHLFPCFASRSSAEQFISSFPRARHDSNGDLLFENIDCISDPAPAHIFVFIDGATRTMAHNWIIPRIYAMVPSANNRLYVETGARPATPFMSGSPFEALKSAYEAVRSLITSNTTTIIADYPSSTGLPVLPKVHIFGYSWGGGVALALARLLNSESVWGEHAATTPPVVKPRPFVSDWGGFKATFDKVPVENVVLIDAIQRANGIQPVDRVSENVHYLFHAFRNTAQDDTRPLWSGDWSNLYDVANFNTDEIVGPPDLVQHWPGISLRHVDSVMMNLPAPAKGTFNDPPFVCNHCYLGQDPAVEAEVLAFLKARGVPIRFP